MSCNRAYSSTATAQLVEDRHVEISSSNAQATSDAVFDTHLATTVVLVDAEPLLNGAAHTTANVVLVDAEAVLNGTAQTTAHISMNHDNHCRAEFLSVTLYKKPASLGISMRSSDDGKVFISKIQPDSLLKGSPLQVGTVLLSINGKRCKTIRQTCDLLISVTGLTLTIVAQNIYGKPSLVEVMVEKPTPNSFVGITARRRRDEIEISKIDGDGLLAGSLLNIGDKILSVNGVDCQHAQTRTTMDIIRSSPKFVTILARTSHTTGVVLQEESFRERPRSSDRGEGGSNSAGVRRGIGVFFDCLGALALASVS